MVCTRVCVFRRFTSNPRKTLRRSRRCTGRPRRVSALISARARRSRARSSRLKVQTTDLFMVQTCSMLLRAPHPHVRSSAVGFDLRLLGHAHSQSEAFMRHREAQEVRSEGVTHVTVPSEATPWFES